ncbi:hypothetical protein GGS20DRAFT_551088 [Poronia punctata]|nr:hypothetical protein GGS20DRAFT_551088 [Poronia punctata]
MTTDASSPRRRHILSSINPDSRSTSPIVPEKTDSRHQIRPEAPPASPEEQEEEPRDDDAEERRKSESAAEAPVKKKTSKKFRFKSKHSRSHRSSRHDDRHRERSSGEPDGENIREREREHDNSESSSSRRHHRNSRHHHRHKRRRTRSRSRSPTPSNPFEPPPLDAEAAFRESLFDAMADDEGAAYWEGVYGQPIHVYPQARPGPEGELERMDDDEYAAYVRQKMWEKTHQGILEERARREERRKAKERRTQAAARLNMQMEESLRRGEERRMRRAWKDRWEAYSSAWDPWDGTLDGLAWPVRSGRREDVAADEVKDFYVLGIDPVEVGEKEFLARLKEERVRWHPDKIQQRLGGNVDEAVMRAVTAVFQIVDKLWSDTRSKQSR